MTEKKYPSLKQQGKNLLQSIGRYIEYFLEQDEIRATQVTPKVYEERIAVCKSCDRCDTVQKRCLECGCYLLVKARLSSEFCPLGKWDVDKSKKTK